MFIALLFPSRGVCVSSTLNRLVKTNPRKRGPRIGFFYAAMWTEVSSKPWGKGENLLACVAGVCFLVTGVDRMSSVPQLPGAEELGKLVLWLHLCSLGEKGGSDHL